MDPEPHEQLPPQLTLAELQSAALDEDWALVDGALDAAADRPETLAWAIEGLSSEEENLRDLAASVFERSKDAIDQVTARRLLDTMQHDTGDYVRFRAACALFAHGDRSERVQTTLRSFLKDEDAEVAAIASEYLAQLKQEP